MKIPGQARNDTNKLITNHLITLITLISNLTYYFLLITSYLKIMPVYSFSQIQAYLQCPLKYKFRYIDKIVPEFEENLHLIL